MRLVVFGSTGKTGRLLVDQALAAGHDVTAFARDTSRMGPPRDRLRVVQGDVLVADSVDRAIDGQDAVLSALSTAPRGSPPVLPQGIGHILDAMEAHAVPRLVCLSAAGAMHEDVGFVLGNLMFAIARRAGRGVFVEHQQMLEELIRRHVEWTAIRAPILTNGPLTARYRIVREGLPHWGFRISRADVAHFMIGQLTNREYVRQMPAIAY